MGTQGSLYKICAMMGNYRTFLLGRPACVNYQQACGMKQSLEETVGLPKKPKRPLTPYFRFLLKARPMIIKSNPNAKITEIAKLAGIEWEKLNESSKQELNVAYRKELVVYEQELQKYNSHLTDDDRMKLKEARQHVVEQREKHKLKLRIKELGKPKRPMTSFIAFMQEKSASRGETPMAQWRTKVVQQWNNLSDKEKEVYVKKQKVNQENYKRELRQWEERMIRLGNIDLVRNEALIEPRPIKKRQPRNKVSA